MGDREHVAAHNGVGAVMGSKRLKAVAVARGRGTIAVEAPSPRYGSTPVDGPVKGKSILLHWERMLDEYYRLMGWDRKTGKPLPETLESVGLGKLVPDIWS